jgi:hypothetical protein
VKFFGFSIGELWKLKKASDQFEKDRKMNYDPKKSLKAGATQILTLILTAIVTALFGVLSDSEAIKAILLNAGVNEAYVAVILLVIAGGLRVAQNYTKHKPPTASNTNAAPLILLCLMPSLASAQDPAPSPRPEASLSCGAMRFVERGAPDSEDFVCRASLAVPAPSGLTLFARADYSRTQSVPAGEELSLDIKTFRSIEGFAGARKDIAPNLSATAFAGVTWNRDRTIEPTDPRLWTVAGGLRYTVPGRGHVVAAAGHHGPVGGTAFLGSVVYDLGENAAWYGDVAIPLGASRFALKPYTVRFGVSARLRGWKF